MRPFEAARFLTIRPFGRAKADEPPERAAGWFPAVGLFLGLVLAGADRWMELARLPGLAAGAILVGLLALVTGGLHLDGLADSADALLSWKGREEKLRIMKDSRTGAHGATAICLAILAKAALISGIVGPMRLTWLVLFPAAGRWAMLPVAWVFPYAREEGTGAGVVKKMRFGAVLLGTVVTFAAVALLWPKGAIALGASALAAFIVGVWAWRAVGGVTGDVLGACCEAGEVVFLAVAAAGIEI
jgi:adenosylcobinamide-GDP ribazoletransferase